MPEQALAALIAAVPELEGLTLATPPPDQVGGNSRLAVEEVEEGFEFTVGVGSGDCPAGCIDWSYTKYLVTTEGDVSERCTWRESSGSGVVEGERC